MTEQTKKPDDRIMVTVNGERQEVFMSGGMIRAIMRHYSEFEDFGQIFNRVEEQNFIIVELLRPRSKVGKPISENYTIDDFEMTMEDTAKLVTWATEHALYFFVESVNSATSLFERNKPELEKLAKSVQSLIGSQDSQENEQSAGPTA